MIANPAQAHVHLQPPLRLLLDTSPAKIPQLLVTTRRRRTVYQGNPSSPLQRSTCGPAKVNLQRANVRDLQGASVNLGTNLKSSSPFVSQLTTYHQRGVFVDSRQAFRKTRAYPRTSPRYSAA